MVMAAVIHEKGPPEVFHWEEIQVPAPGPGEVRLCNSAIGVNYVDTYHRRGMPHPWPVPALPLVLGFEGVGVVEAVGADVDDYLEGDRVCYALPPHGAYAQARVYPAEKLIPAPPGIDDNTIAAMLLKGLTAQYLLRRTYAVRPGDIILVHAAAGGMGQILCQWGRHLGATVVGTVGTEDKVAVARAAGAHHVAIPAQEDFQALVMEVSGGEGCHVVYESIGKDTFRKSMACLRPLGMLASYGHASGPPDPVDVIELGAKGSLFLTRPAIMHYMADREDRLAAAKDLFEVVENGAVRIAVNHLYPLSEAAAAHRAIEERRTTGSTVLLPFG
jgi:NADPH2:quinone reductase